MLFFDIHTECFSVITYRSAILLLFFYIHFSVFIAQKYATKITAPTVPKTYFSIKQDKHRAATRIVLPKKQRFFEIGLKRTFGCVIIESLKKTQHRYYSELLFYLKG